MRYVFVLVAAIIGLSFIATLISNNDGVVSFYFARYGTFQLNFSIFIVYLTVLIVAAIIIIWFIMFMYKIPRNLALYSRRSSAQKAHRLLQLGMVSLGNGQYKDAEKKLVKGAKISMDNNQDAGIYWSNAALAAQKQNKLDKRDEYLLEARKLEADGHDTNTNLFSEASLYIDSGEFQHAIDLLDKKSNLSYNPHFMSIKYRAYIGIKDFGNAWELLMSMGKNLTKDDFINRKRELAKEIFIDNTYDFNLDKQVWGALPKDMKAETEMVLYYVSALIENGEPTEAEAILSKAIKSDMADPLIHAYGQLEFGSNLDKLKKVESWLKYKQDNPYLNYAAANFSFQLEKVEDAKVYAEKSIKQLVMPETLALLGKIYEKLGDAKSALSAYRETVKLTYDDFVDKNGKDNEDSNQSALVLGSDSSTDKSNSNNNIDTNNAEKNANAIEMAKS